MNATELQPGIILLDKSLSVIAANLDAVKILAFPEPPEKLGNLSDWLTKKIHASLVRKPLTEPSFVSVFRSAQRMYLCHALRLDSGANVHARPAVTLILERKPNGARTVAEISHQFGLTAREQETMRLLAEGFCSKEIAARMNISPNTVKAFVHLVMVKMSVSTRSGIIGKMVGVDNMNNRLDREKKSNFL